MCLSQEICSGPTYRTAYDKSYPIATLDQRIASVTVQMTTVMAVFVLQLKWIVVCVMTQICASTSSVQFS